MRAEGSSRFEAVKITFGAKNANQPVLPVQASNTTVSLILKIMIVCVVFFFNPRSGSGISQWAEPGDTRAVLIRKVVLELCKQ